MVKIITDTTACVSPEFARNYQIPIIPQVINFGEESFYEGVDIDTKGFMDRLKKSAAIPKTAAPPPELFAKEFDRILRDSETILCIHPSSDVSGTVRSAIVAARDFPDADIRVIDSRLVASPLGTLVMLAAEWAEAGVDADTIVARLEQMSKRCRIYFIVDSLDFLARGGRIGGAAALLGGVLQIKPILRLHEGKVDQYERERTQRRAIARIKDIVSEQIPHDGSGYLTILEAGAYDLALSLADDLGQLINQTEVLVYNMPPAIVVHGGPGILGVGFFVKG
jgi:DegV family protein with EDD domain